MRRLLGIALSITGACALAACATTDAGGGMAASGAAAPPPGVVYGAPGDEGTVGGVPVRFAPEPLNRVPPDYPSGALRERIEAACTINFDLNPDGEPTDLCAACSAGGDWEAAFEQETLRTVAKWRYPAAIAGSESRTDLTLVMAFALQGISGEPETPPPPACEG